LIHEVRSLIVDISTAALPNAADYIDMDGIKVPSNYKNQVAIDTYRAEAAADKLNAAALDFDLARITGIGFQDAHGPNVFTTGTDATEEQLIASLAAFMVEDYRLISYNGSAFDWPMLMRRARYLGVPFPVINTDKYRGPHHDLMLILNGRDSSRTRSLAFYVKRMGWTDLKKPLTGLEESQVPTTGKWAELSASLAHDVEAIRRLAVWAGVL
jgi:hypothetical protein